jgi:hypothetical protein
MAFYLGDLGLESQDHGGSSVNKMALECIFVVIAEIFPLVSEPLIVVIPYHTNNRKPISDVHFWIC